MTWALQPCHIRRVMHAVATIIGDPKQTVIGKSRFIVLVVPLTWFVSMTRFWTGARLRAFPRRLGVKRMKNKH
jgi:hypothetical protein